MKPLALLWIVSALWALLHFWLVPLVQERWVAITLRDKMARAGTLVVLEKSRDLCGAAAAAVAFVLLVVLAAQILGEAGVLFPRQAIDGLAALYRGAKALADGYGAFLTGVGVVGACGVLWVTARRARARVAEAWIAAARQAHAAYLEDPQAIESARAHPELAPHVDRVDRAVSRVLELQAMDPVPEDELGHARSAVDRALSGLAIESAAQRIDFPDAAATPAAEESRADAAPPVAWRRLGRAVRSKRLGQDLGLVGKWMGRAVTALLVVSVTGWAAEPLASSLQLTVNNLRVQLVAHDAQRNLDEALTQAAPAPQAAEPEAAQPPLPANAVQTASRLVARAAVHEMTRAPLLDQTAGIRRARADRAEFVRALLAEQRLAAGGETASAVRAEAAARTAGAAAEAVSTAEKHVQAMVEPAMDQLRQRHPTRLTALIQSLEARYAAPMSPLDAQGNLMAKVLDEAFSDANVFKAEGELGKQAQKLTKDFGKKAVKSWADAAVKQFVADALRGAAQGDVVRAFGFEASQASQDFLRALARQEGHGWQAAASQVEDDRVARAVAEKVADLHGEARGPERDLLRQRLSGYGALFPQEQPVVASAEDLLHGPAAGGGGRGGGGARSPAHASPARATSFSVASRSFRVRGVLVGQDLESSALDVTDLRWQSVAPAGAGEPTRVRLALRLAASPGAMPQWLEAGSFDAGVVNQALRYAADRRVVATTITPGDGRAIGRLTYLHPVLADTPLGCRVVEIDRVVDTFTSPRGNPQMPAPIKALAADRAAMYQWLTVADLAERLASRAGACPVDQVRQVVEKRGLGTAAFSPSMRKALQDFIVSNASASPGSDALIRRVHACTGGEPAALPACLCADGAGDRSNHYWYPEDHTSQVRERPARLSADLAWLRPSADRLGHLDFWTHTTFSLRDGATGASDESRTAAADFPQEHLEALRTEVARRLPGYLAGPLRSPSYDHFMRPLEEFVLVQRLARAALEGRLGRDFPLTRLLELQRETRAFVPSQPTLRWEAGLSHELLRLSLQKADAKAVQQYEAFLRDQAEREAKRRPMCDAASR